MRVWCGWVLGRPSGRQPGVQAAWQDSLPSCRVCMHPPRPPLPCSNGCCRYSLEGDEDYRDFLAAAGGGGGDDLGTPRTPWRRPLRLGSWFLRVRRCCRCRASCRAQQPPLALRRCAPGPLLHAHRTHMLAQAPTAATRWWMTIWRSWGARRCWRPTATAPSPARSCWRCKTLWRMRRSACLGRLVGAGGVAGAGGAEVRAARTHAMS